jgi:Kef-type K+ transport system membrane component KefB
MVLGPSILGLIHYGPEIKALANVGVLLLVFMAGMEIDPESLRAAFRGRGSWVAATGFGVPLALGIIVAALFGLDRTRMVFIGLCVAITALPVSVRILMDLNQLHSSVGKRIISAAVANDVAALLVLGIILNVKAQGAAHQGFLVSIVLVLAKALIFMVGFVVVSRVVRHYFARRRPFSAGLMDRLLARLKGRESLFGITFLFVVAFAAFSQFLGLDFVIGAFFGSMLLSHEVLGVSNFENVQKTAANVTMGFLGPIFFAAIGLEFDARTLRDWRLASAILFVAFLGKILGGYVGGKLARLTGGESWALGVGLNGRGVMELVIADIAFQNSFIGEQLFTILVLMAVVTTFITPWLLKRAYDRLAVPGSEVSPVREMERVSSG